MILIILNLKHISSKPEAFLYRESRHYKYFIGFLWETLTIESSYQVILYLYSNSNLSYERLME